MMPDKNNRDCRHWVVLSLGSNRGDRHAHIRQAVESLAPFFTDGSIQLSPLYETPCCNGFGDLYINAVLRACTYLSVADLHKITKDIEVKHGREPDSKTSGSIPLDIDIVVADRNILRPDDFDKAHFIIGYRSLHDDCDAPTLPD